MLRRVPRDLESYGTVVILPVAMLSRLTLCPAGGSGKAGLSSGASSMGAGAGPRAPRPVAAGAPDAGRLATVAAGTAVGAAVPEVSLREAPAVGVQLTAAMNVPLVT